MIGVDINFKPVSAWYDYDINSTDCHALNKNFILNLDIYEIIGKGGYYIYYTFIKINKIIILLF